MMNSLKLLILLPVFSLVACGGGSGSGDGGGTPPRFAQKATEVTEAELYALIDNFFGTFSVAAQIKFDLDQSIAGAGSAAQIAASGDFSTTRVISRTQNQAGAFLTDNCDIDGPTPETTELTENEFFPKSGPAFFGEDLSCETYSSNYFKFDDVVGFGVSYNCDGQDVGTVAVTRVSESPIMEFGSFSINTQELALGSSGTEVCGSLTRLALSTSFTGIENAQEQRNFVQLSLRAPYGSGDFVLLDLQFQNSSEAATLPPGRYQVSSTEAPDTVSAFFNSNFISNEIFVPLFEGIDGEVTVTSSSATAISGSYSIETATRGVFTGEFSLDLP